MHRLTDSSEWDVFKGWCAITLGVVLAAFFGLSLIIGVVVTTVASVLPARRAARVAPIEALRDSQDAGADHLGRRSVIGVIVTALGLAFLGYGLFGEPDNAGLLIGGGAAVIFIGIAILSPLAARPL